MSSSAKPVRVHFNSSPLPPLPGSLIFNGPPHPHGPPPTNPPAAAVHKFLLLHPPERLPRQTTLSFIHFILPHSLCWQRLLQRRWQQRLRQRLRQRGRRRRLLRRRCQGDDALGLVEQVWDRVGLHRARSQLVGGGTSRRQDDSRAHLPVPFGRRRRVRALDA